MSPATGPIVIGAPVKVNNAAAANDLGLPTVALATGAQVPVPGICGIAVYEYKGSEGWAGVDPFLTTYSDLSTVPVSQALQVVSGDSVKVAFRNTSTQTFLNTRSYAGRIMVAGFGGATSTLAVGDYLTPGLGDDTNGYWGETSTLANAWLVVTRVDLTRGEVEARLLF